MAAQYNAQARFWRDAGAVIRQQLCQPGDCPPHRGSGMLAAADQATGLGPRGLCILAQAASPDRQDHG